MSLFELSLCTASLAHFFQYCLTKGNILRGYNNLITINLYLKNPQFTGLYKVLGGCIYCNGTWIFICTYLIHIFSISNFILCFIELFLGIGLNYIWIKILEKL